MQLYLCLVVLSLSALSQVLADHPDVPNYNDGGFLWPLPSQYTQTQIQFTIDPATFTFAASGPSNGILLRAFQRYQKLSFPGSFGRPSTKPSPNAVNQLVVTLAAASETDQIQFGTDESYSLSVTAQGASINAKTVFGALRGLETFSQLVVHVASTYTINETSIQDAPRFPWRGILLDTSRHWLPVETILETIQAMSYSKMNTLHWHVVDGQSFPYESKVYPLLSQQGSYRPNQVFTQMDIKKIIAYGNDYGVRIVPEFDMPAHSTSWGFGYDFMTVKCYSRSDPYDFNDGWGDDPMDPTNPKVYEFIENFLTEAVSIFPDHWLHLGGDEINYQCWNTTSINEYMQQNGIKTYNELEAKFIEQINTFIKAKLDRNLVYWQEVFQETTPFIGTAVDIWKDANTLSQVIKQGISAIQSFGWYLDHLDDDWDTFYRQEPIPAGSSPAQAKLILGGEGSMWGETVDATNVHQKVWPRVAAVAERLWSPVTVRNVTAAIPRLSQHRCRYVQRGIPAQPFQPGPGCY